MQIDGECHCGAIAYTAEIDPEKVVVCHCADCQTMSGGAFRVSTPSLPDSFHLLRGAPKVYVKTADSGAPREQGFCPDCGTALFSSTPGGGPKVHILRTGAIRQRTALVPQVQIWRRSQVSWLATLATLAATDAQPERK